MYENLFNLIDDLQKATMKIKIQEVLNALCTDERVHEILDADIVLEYYEKMHEHFEKNPKDFLFPNREWLRESLKRLKVNLSNVFDEDANIDHVKREEVTVLFMLLWINMQIQDQSTASCAPIPYDLFCLWKYDRVLIARPTDTRYLQKDDIKVLDRFYDKYGWFTPMHHFTIGVKGDVEYDYMSPDNITNIDGAYNKPHGSVTKLRDICDWTTDRLLHEQRTLADADKKHWGLKNSLIENKTPLVWEHNIESVSVKVPDHIKKQLYKDVIDFDEVKDVLSQLTDDLLEEKQRRHKVARNTKFVIQEMTGYSNTSYKILLEDYYRTKFDKPIDPYIKEIVDVLAKDYGVNLDSDFISYAKKNATAKPDSPFQTVAIIDIINAMIKLKEKLNEEKDQ